MQIYDHTDYREFIRDWLETQPKAGRGLLRGWAEKFGVHPSLFSQILGGTRTLTLELSDQVAEEMQLSDAESRYFENLVLYAHAGTERLRRKLKKRIEESRLKSRQLGERVRADATLSEETKTVYYSNWIYTGIRNMTGVPELQSIDAMSAHLGLPRDVVANVVDFLVASGLCAQVSGRIVVGDAKTYVPSDSPLVAHHHRNWRLHGFSKMPLKRADDFFLTMPMSLSKADAEKIRGLIPGWFDEVNRIVTPSPSEAVKCLNIDYFGY